jgi:DNA-binding CsgD family transcriptional regulator
MAIVNGTGQAALRAIVQLSGLGLGAEALLYQVADHLRSAIPFDTGSWLVYDPDAMLPVAGVPIDDNPSFETRLRYCANEHLVDDVNKFRDLAKRRVPVDTIEQATRGRPQESRRFRELLEPFGLGHELRLVLVSHGACWGTLTLRRATRSPGFSASELAIAARIAAPVAEGLSRAAVAAPVEAASADPPGLVLLDDRGTISAVTGAAQRWLQLMNDGRPRSYPPLAVATVAMQARVREQNDADFPALPPARLKVRTSSGQWLQLDGATYHDPTTRERHIAVIVQPASFGEVLSLVARRYDLTAREQTVVRLILQGLATRHIAANMQISPLTVQDHLKAVFAKTGVSTRRELAFRLALPSR